MILWMTIFFSKCIAGKEEQTNTQQHIHRRRKLGYILGGGGGGKASEANFNTGGGGGGGYCKMYKHASMNTLAREYARMHLYIYTLISKSLKSKQAIFMKKTTTTNII